MMVVPRQENPLVDDKKAFAGRPKTGGNGAKSQNTKYPSGIMVHHVACVISCRGVCAVAFRAVFVVCPCLQRCCGLTFSKYGHARKKTSSLLCSAALRWVERVGWKPSKLCVPL